MQPFNLNGYDPLYIPVAAGVMYILHASRHDRETNSLLKLLKPSDAYMRQ